MTSTTQTGGCQQRIFKMANEQGRRITVVMIDFETGYNQQFQNADEPIPCVGDVLIRLKFDRVTESSRVVVTDRIMVYSDDDRLLSVTLKVRKAGDLELSGFEGHG
jgi:hypothetical protein